MSNIIMQKFESDVQGHWMFRWFPVVFMSLQQLFSVGHSFVIRKMLILLCPFIKKKEVETSWGGDMSHSAGNMNECGLKVDTEEADLYIPCMAYVTYVLLYGVQRGMIKEFTPEVLSSAFSWALVLFILEIGAFYMGLYFSGNPIPALQIVANCGYKYFHVLLMVLCRILLGKSLIYYVFFAYFSACAAWATRRFMLRLEPSQLREQYGVPASSLTKHIITGMAVAQIPICWILTPSST